MVPSPPAAAESATPGQSAASESAASTDRPCFGDYELLETIGIGGVGIVWKARQVSLNRIVALKMIRRHEFVSVAAVERFRTEAEAVASLDHPNIVPIYEVGECHGQQFFSMKLIDGGSLARYLAESASVCPLPRDAAEGGPRHHRGVGSALRRTSGASCTATSSPTTSCLIARVNRTLQTLALPRSFSRLRRDDSHRDANRRSRRWNEPNTPGRVPGDSELHGPEQAAGTRSLTTAVDVYGLGAILYQLLTGRPVFTGATLTRSCGECVTRHPIGPARSTHASPPTWKQFV